MSAFNDGSCMKCKRRMGWKGEVTDKPICPNCGHEPTPKEIKDLVHDKKIMDEFRDHLLRKMEMEEADKEGGP